MRESTAPRKLISWMDRERDLEEWLSPGRFRVSTGAYGFLAAARRDNLERIVARARTRGRMPRVCLYALAFGGQEPRHSFSAAAACAVRQCWQVGAGQSYADHHGAGAPTTRPGWCGVRRQILAGYADGVVVVTADVISSDMEEYRQELDWFEHKGFVAVVIPETGRGQA
ncbi:hypothetical protein LRE75_17840 [Streptomyces sp. 372A]